MNNTYRNWILGVLILLIVAVLLYTFSDIFIYFVIAIILSFIGRPLVRLFEKVKIKNWRCPRTAAVAFTMVTLCFVISLFFTLIVPQLVSQMEKMDVIDEEMVQVALAEPIEKFEKFASKYGLIPSEIEQDFKERILENLAFKNISSSIGSIIGTIGEIVIAIFSIAFITFFFLKDSYLFDKIIYAITPDSKYNKVTNAISSTSSLLTRYFIGIVIQISTIMLLLFIGISLLGVENALLIAFLAGIFNIIPYVGPLMGIIMGLLLGLTSSIELDFYSQTVPLLTKMLGIMVLVQLIDNFVLQPLIFSKSVKAHPLEIFVVILMAATLGGVIGMVIAIPAYTIIRVFAKEFLTRFKLVRSLTKNI